ncbi:RNA-directed DNA polymerase, eukaryota, reverse transcriptase zinc-binding domain protein [Tanacetum coccineum]
MEAVVDRSPNLTCVALPRWKQKYYPLLLKDERNDYGPNSFKIFNSWMEIDRFDEMVKNSCMEFQPNKGDSKCVVLKSKLKYVKIKIKVWHAQRGVIKWVNIMELDAIELKDNAQKSKKKWIKEGGENTKLFHGMLKRKRSQKNVTGVVIDGDWVTDLQLVKEAFREFYANKLKSFSSFRLSNRSQCDKAPGPNEFQTKVVDFIHEFSDSGVITPGCNASFITLIPTYGALMVNKIVTWAKKQKKKMVLKVDFEKAYNSLSWDYLDCILEYMGFGDTWRKWIRRCLVLARASVLLNGISTKEFQLHRGLRQGDHLSLFLLILATEGLHILIEDVVQYSQFRKAPMGSSSIIMSHIFYADYAIFIDLARCKGCGADSVPFMYLGLLVGERMYRVNSWTPLMAKFKKCLANWKSKLMSIGGRLTLHWRFLNGNDMMWREGGFLDGGTTPKSGVWAGIVKDFMELHTRGLVSNSVIRRKVGNGRNMRFWKEMWCGDGTLEAIFPRLAGLASNRDAFVSDYWSIHGWNISWRRDIKSGVE